MMSEQCDHSNLQRRKWLTGVSNVYFSPKPKLLLEVSSTISRIFDTSWLVVNMKTKENQIRFKTLDGLPESICIRQEVIDVFRPEPKQCILNTSIATQLFMNTITDVCTPLETIIIGNTQVTWVRPLEQHCYQLPKYLMDNPKKYSDMKQKCFPLLKSLEDQNVRFPLLTLDMFEVNLDDESLRISDARLLSSQTPSVLWRITSELLKSDKRWDDSSFQTDQQFVEAQWKAIKTII